MTRLYTFLITIILSVFTVSSQNSSVPYEWDWKKDGVYTATALLGSGTGLYLVVNKNRLTESELNTIVANQDNINSFDRWAVANDSQLASDLSDIPFYLSFAAPLVLFFEDDVNDNGGLVFGLFLKSMATGALYGISAGLIDKSRPYVYSDDVDFERRTSGSGQRSFFSGHTAATATATFFVAKVYQDFNPNSPGVPYVWAGAAILPALVGYLRIEAGQHFPTDTLVGYTVGALTGYFIPHFNKKRKDSKLNVSPVMGQTRFGDTYQGLSLNYTF